MPPSATSGREAPASEEEFYQEAGFSAEDPVAPAKILSEFAKDHKALEIKAGILDGAVIGLDEVKALADLPSREVLLAKLIGSMQAPISGLVNVLHGTLRNFVYVVDAVRQKTRNLPNGWFDSAT